MSALKRTRKNFFLRAVVDEGDFECGREEEEHFACGREDEQLCLRAPEWAKSTHSLSQLPLTPFPYS